MTHSTQRNHPVKVANPSYTWNQLWGCLRIGGYHPMPRTGTRFNKSRQKPVTRQGFSVTQTLSPTICQSWRSAGRQISRPSRIIARPQWFLAGAGRERACWRRSSWSSGLPTPSAGRYQSCRTKRRFRPRASSVSVICDQASIDPCSNPAVGRAFGALSLDATNHRNGADRSVSSSADCCCMGAP